MPGNVGAAAGFKPGFGRRGVGHRLDGGKSFAGDEKQRVLRLQVPERGGQFVPIDVGHKVKAFGGRDKLIQRQHHHLRPQVGAANADVHHVGDGLVCPHRLGVGQHRVQRQMNLLQCIFYIFCVWCICSIFNSVLTI